MTITKTEIPAHIEQLLDVHNTLWDALSDSYAGLKLDYKGSKYDIYKPEHNGFTSTVLSNDNGKNFLWITQNLNKSSYGSFEIKRARSQGDDKRITWIVDNSNDKFYYCALIKTCVYFDGKKDILVERYINDNTEVVYCTNPTYASYVTHKSKY
jgi:hypothetical protein